MISFKDPGDPFIMIQERIAQKLIPQDLRIWADYTIIRSCNHIWIYFNCPKKEVKARVILAISG
jgi:hypothetical protein